MGELSPTTVNNPILTRWTAFGQYKQTNNRVSGLANDFEIQKLNEISQQRHSVECPTKTTKMSSNSSEYRDSLIDNEDSVVSINDSEIDGSLELCRRTITSLFLDDSKPKPLKRFRSPNPLPELSRLRLQGSTYSPPRCYFSTTNRGQFSVGARKCKSRLHSASTRRFYDDRFDWCPRYVPDAGFVRKPSISAFTTERFRAWIRSELSIASRHPQRASTLTLNQPARCLWWGNPNLPRDRKSVV